MKELIALYQGDSLPELRIQYKDFVEWEENGDRAFRKLAHREYWKRQYQSGIPVLDLRVDYPRPVHQTYEESGYLVVNNYGPTETAVVAAAHTVRRSEYQSPIERSIFNTEIYILEDQDTLLPVNVPGELCIAGAGLADGYLSRPELIKEKFVSNPFHKGEKMYRGLGQIFVEGLSGIPGKDQQVKIRGYRIELEYCQQQKPGCILPRKRLCCTLKRVDG